MVNTFDPDALIVGGGRPRGEPGVFSGGFLEQIRVSMACPAGRSKPGVPIYVMPEMADTAGGARGRLFEALKTRQAKAVSCNYRVSLEAGYPTC